MAEVLRQITRIDIPTTVLGGGLLIAAKELRKQSIWYKNVTKYAGRFDEATLPIAAGVVGTVIRQPVLQKMLIVGLMISIKNAYDEFTKEPWVYAPDALTLECKYFDANSRVNVVIDGATVSFATEPTTDANGYAKITLPTAIEAGVHTVIVWTGGGKAWSGIVVA